MRLKTLVLCAALACGSGAHAQTSMHWKKDNITGNLTALSDKVKISQGGAPALLRTGDGCKYKVYLRFTVVDGKSYLSLSEDSDGCFCTITGVSFKLDDGTVIQKTAGVVEEPIKTPLGTEQPVSFELTHGELAAFSTSVVARFRVTEQGCSDHPSINDELEDKDASKIKDMAAAALKCIRPK